MCILQISLEHKSCNGLRTLRKSEEMLLPLLIPGCTITWGVQKFCSDLWVSWTCHVPKKPANNMGTMRLGHQCHVQDWSLFRLGSCILWSGAVSRLLGTSKSFCHEPKPQKLERAVGLSNDLKLQFDPQERFNVHCYEYGGLSPWFGCWRKHMSITLGVRESPNSFTFRAADIIILQYIIIYSHSHYGTDLDWKKQWPNLFLARWLTIPPMRCIK